MMEYKIEDKGDQGELVIIDLPLEISKVDYSFEYFDNNLNRMRATHPNFWVVIESDLTPKNMEVKVNEFKEVKNAVEHAITLYNTYLRLELRRLRDASECD